MATQTPFPQIAAFALWLAVAQAWPALAQDSDDDWDIVRDRRGRAEMAHLQFSNGLAIMVQCKDRSLDVVMGGLPPASARPGRLGFRERPLDLRFRGEEDRRQFWAVGADDTLAVSLLPAPFARQLRQGGTLELGVPDAGDEGQMVTYRGELPPSALNVDEVLTACRRPLVDPRDELLDEVGATGLPVRIVWAEQPNLVPRASDLVSGFAVVSCLTRPNGRLHNCVVESEHPRGATAARSSSSAARRARVEVAGAPDAPVPPVIVHFTLGLFVD